MFIDIYVVSHAHIYHSLSHSAIKVWDFQAALDPRSQADTLCLRTLMVSRSLLWVDTGKVGFCGGHSPQTLLLLTPKDSQRLPKIKTSRRKHDFTSQFVSRSILEDLKFLGGMPPDPPPPLPDHNLYSFYLKFKSSIHLEP